MNCAVQTSDLQILELVGTRTERAVITWSDNARLELPMNNVSLIGAVSGVPRAHRDGSRRWATLSIVVVTGEERERFEVVAEGRAVPVVLDRRPGQKCQLAIDGRLARGPAGGVVVVAEHALWFSAAQIEDLSSAVRPISDR
jgi:hypothetical protein